MFFQETDSGISQFRVTWIQTSILLSILKYKLINWLFDWLILKYYKSNGCTNILTRESQLDKGQTNIWHPKMVLWVLMNSEMQMMDGDV